jgi:hypothetical protein
MTMSVLFMARAGEEERHESGMRKREPSLLFFLLCSFNSLQIGIDFMLEERNSDDNGRGGEKWKNLQNDTHFILLTRKSELDSDMPSLPRIISIKALLISFMGIHFSKGPLSLCILMTSERDRRCCFT